MKIAVVLFNLGGPDGQEAVEPFLRNLFSDPAIVGLPGGLRQFLARLIARRRAPIARAIYQRMGGGSPIVANTEIQARALETALADLGEVRAVMAMRYWHPRAKEAARAVGAFNPDRVVLLPLYPQYSTTTSASSLREWRREARAVGLSAPMHTICCYPLADGFVEAAAAKIRPVLAAMREKGTPRLLFSAHGLPERVVKSGDPYQWQVEQSAAAIAARLGNELTDWRVCFQSRVGPLKWIGPATEDEIRRAGEDKVPLVVFPIAFVSEHSETLVELDEEYGELAHEVGVPAYGRVGTVDAQTHFIDALAREVRMAITRAPGLAGPEGRRCCPGEWTRCAYLMEGLS